MYKIRFTNSEGKTTVASIANLRDFRKVVKAEAMNAIIDCQVGNNMPVSLHNAIAAHNAKIERA